MYFSNGMYGNHIKEQLCFLNNKEIQNKHIKH